SSIICQLVRKRRQPSSFDMSLRLSLRHANKFAAALFVVIFSILISASEHQMKSDASRVQSKQTIPVERGGHSVGWIRVGDFCLEIFAWRFSLGDFCLPRRSSWRLPITFH